MFTAGCLECLSSNFVILRGMPTLKDDSQIAGIRCELVSHIALNRFTLVAMVEMYTERRK